MKCFCSCFPFSKDIILLLALLMVIKMNYFFSLFFSCFFVSFFLFQRYCCKKSVHVKCKCLHLRTDICPNRCVFTIKKASIELGSLRYQCIVLRRSREDGFFVFSLFIFYQVYFTNISNYTPFLPLCS